MAVRKRSSEAGFFTLELVVVIWILSWLIMEASGLYQELNQFRRRQEEQALLFQSITTWMEEGRDALLRREWYGEERIWHEEIGSDTWYLRQVAHAEGEGLYQLELRVEGGSGSYAIQTWIFLPPPAGEGDAEDMEV